MRPKISKVKMAHTVTDIDTWLLKRIKQKGRGSFISVNEIRGVIDEEYCELREEMHIRDYDGIEHELKDVAVAAIFGLASLRKMREEGKI
jgi:hypothetical protein